jgi:hypothetical protein
MITQNDENLIGTEDIFVLHMPDHAGEIHQ